MNLTKSRLKLIIREEVRKLLNEDTPPGPAGYKSGGTVVIGGPEQGPDPHAKKVYPPGSKKPGMPGSLESDPENWLHKCDVKCEKLRRSKRGRRQSRKLSKRPMVIPKHVLDSPGQYNKINEVLKRLNKKWKVIEMNYCTIKAADDPGACYYVTVNALLCRKHLLEINNALRFPAASAAKFEITDDWLMMSQQECLKRYPTHVFNIKRIERAPPRPRKS
jgi:hypothetical protein